MCPEQACIRADQDELAFVAIEIADSDGVVEMLADERVSLEVAGPATLLGFGTAAPASEEPFTGIEHSTFRGRALAILRPTGEPGVVRVTARSQSAGVASVEITAQSAPHNAAAEYDRSAVPTQ
ncbi:hypothetical protein RIU76_11975 [Latilactobacillus sakei subsp. sakei]|uniref:hypothetical protein n=1 Tax=Latilactobacillus sakei TaxID=1599 RepID=UPI00285E97D8|nr:hypothetical protein [Latilactobacillus sakei]MDR7925391.1 hypothetical protein [Latilactobacillus sakei subsp. sakei]